VSINARLGKYSAEEVGFAVWRVWAAEVRDRAGCHGRVSPAVAAWAGLLARLLDSWEGCRRRADSPGSAGNLADGLEASVEALVAKLLAAGVAPPAPVRASLPPTRRAPSPAATGPPGTSGSRPG